MSSKKVVGYCRFSSDNQREESITAQKRLIGLWAKDNSIVIDEWYCDRAKSGKTADRPEFQRMLRDARQGDISTIVIHKLDRFSRNLVDTLQYRDVFTDCGCRLISVSEKLEDTPTGKLMISIMGSVNQFYIDNLAQEVIKGMRESALERKWTGGIPPLGYDVKDHYLVINEREAEAVRLIFQSVVDGYGYTNIIEQLNQLGYKTKKGRPFGKNSLYEIIHNERYKGVFIWNRVASPNSANKRNNHRSKAPEEIIRIEDGCPAIVSTEIWNKANAIRRMAGKGSTTAKHQYLLTGLLVCGDCGSKMSGNSYNTTDGHTSYRCCKKSSSRQCSMKEIRTEPVDRFVVHELCSMLFTETTIPIITQRLQTYVSQRYEQDEKYQAAKENLRVAIRVRDNLIDALAKMGFSESLSARLKEEEAQIEASQKYLDEYEQNRVQQTITEDMVRQQIEKIKSWTQGAECFDRFKYTIQQYVEKVEIGYESVKVIFKADFTLENDECVPFRHESVISRKELYRLYGEKLSANDVPGLAKAQVDMIEAG